MGEQYGLPLHIMPVYKYYTVYGCVCVCVCVYLCVSVGYVRELDPVFKQAGFNSQPLLISSGSLRQAVTLIEPHFFHLQNGGKHDT
jgi:hypothetical protein